MAFGSLGAKALDLKRSLRHQSCERCGLLFDPESHDRCPHCRDLDARGLAELKDRISAEREGHRRLGSWFLLGAIGLLVLTLLSFA